MSGPATDGNARIARLEAGVARQAESLAKARVSVLAWRDRAEKAEAEVAQLKAELRDKRDFWSKETREAEAELIKSRAQAAALRAALEAASAAMAHMGDTINAMDAVTEEDEKHFPAFEAVRAALAPDAGPRREDESFVAAETRRARYWRERLEKQGWRSPEQARALVDRVVEACARKADSLIYGSGDSAFGQAIRALDRAALVWTGDSPTDPAVKP